MIVLIDNYDSFTYNLVHYLGQLGADVKVFRNDHKTADEILSLDNLKGIVISPGPCTPNESGICLDLVKKIKGNIPLLGVCLGHEVIGQVFGGKIVKVPPMHGKTSIIKNNGNGIFNNLPKKFTATRYHSLVIDKNTLPDCLEITASTTNNLIMGVMHKTYPIFGVQFHPESIATEFGHELLGNFLALCKL